MATRAYILIEAAVGKAKPVAEGGVGMSFPNARVVTVDAVTGPYDVIAVVEGTDLTAVGNLVTNHIHPVGGIARTVTCLAIDVS